MTSLISDMLTQVKRFQREVLDFPIPDKPTYLTGDAYGHKIGHLNEEMIELMAAHDMEGQADALVDLVYVALGALIQMGICPGAAFEEVHNRNMDREPREDADRFGGEAPDAVKPAGWTPPDWEKLLHITLFDVDYLTDLKAQADAYTGDEFKVMFPIPAPMKMVGPDRGRMEAAKAKRRPKILVIGHARHGKDTLCEVLRDRYGLRFTSSSLFCAERVMMPYFRDRLLDPRIDGAMVPPPIYSCAAHCFDDRMNYREEWYKAISAFNRPDPTTLARAILEENDVYCGMRSSTELNACKNSGLFDYIIWVDGRFREPPEDRSSCTVEPWMADYVVDANYKIEDMEFALGQLMEHLNV